MGWLGWVCKLGELSAFWVRYLSPPWNLFPWLPGLSILIVEVKKQPEGVTFLPLQCGLVGWVGWVSCVGWLDWLGGFWLGGLGCLDGLIELVWWVDWVGWVGWVGWLGWERRGVPVGHSLYSSFCVLTRQKEQVIAPGLLHHGTNPIHNPSSHNRVISPRPHFRITSPTLGWGFN